MKKNNNKKWIGKYVMLIPAIIVMNFLGVCYASFNEGLNITASVAAGSIQPTFGQDMVIDKLAGNGNLTIQFDDENTMNVQGTVYSDYYATINYNLLNQGNVPVKFIGEETTTDEGLTLQLDPQPEILEPVDTLSGKEENVKLHIHADKEGTHKFEMALIFQPGNE